MADAIDGTPRTAAELAPELQVNADALDRVMRLLATHGIFDVTGNAFTHTAASWLLRSDHPQSMRAFVRLFGLDAFWGTQGALLHSVRTGEPSAKELFPGGFYGLLKADANTNAVFNAAMAAKARGQVAAVLAAYDFSKFATVGDIGGGLGHLLRGILASVPNIQGVLFDRPPVIQEATPLFAPDRVRLQPGDLFQDAVPACDVYVVMEVIHAFGDADALHILRAIRKAAAPKATLLVIEQMIPDDNSPHWARTLDIHMLALLGGQQRSRQQYVALLEQAGFAFQGEIHTRAGVSILESTAV